MPNRILRDCTDSDKINVITVHAERFFYRLIMKVDDYGCFFADTRLLKANLFPLLLDNIREADLLRWMTECHKAGLIVLYESANKKYLQINDFRQRLDKAKAKFPLPKNNESVEVVNEFPPEVETETNQKKKKKPEKETKVTPNGAGEPQADSPLDLKGLYEDLIKEKTSLAQFIKQKKPDFIEPYVDLWNLFAQEKKLAQLQKITDTRKKKFKARIAEKTFDFLFVLKKAAASNFLLTGSWFCFDWLIENESNYLKVIEGNYDKSVIESKQNGVPEKFTIPLTTKEKQMNAMYSIWMNGKLKMRDFDDSEYDFMLQRGMSFTEGQTANIQDAVQEYMTAESIPNNDSKAAESLLKRFAVIEHFKGLKAKGKEVVF
jgi:hypothetical protein